MERIQIWESSSRIEAIIEDEIVLRASGTLHKDLAELGFRADTDGGSGSDGGSY